MVFFVLTRSGYDDLYQRFGSAPSPLWVNAGVLSLAELEKIRADGSDITNFTHTINPLDTEAIRDAIHTIQEHHPGHQVWVEYAENL